MEVDAVTQAVGTAEVERAANYWNNIPPQPAKSRWWQWPRIITFLNDRITPGAGTTWNAALLKEVRERRQGGKMKKAISVACGNGAKEMALIKAGLVEQFDLFEVSEKRVGIGQALYSKAGLSDRVTWRIGDGVSAMEQGQSYDLVFWDNALHHMPDTHRAITASRDCLRPGGLFVMNDFIGPDRFQWTDRQLHYATSVRSRLSKRLLRHPSIPEKSIRPFAKRPTIEAMIADDPSEAADSSRILERVKMLLPNPSVWMLGGCIYFIALNDVLANIDLEHDADLLESLLILDEALSELGENLYAACISVRPN